MDPDDDSVPGIAKYLVYRKRKQIEFLKDITFIQYGSREGLDPSESIKKLTDMEFPEDMKERLVKSYQEEKMISEESQKKIKVVKSAHGAISLKVG